jgi:hypothetical protein
MYTLCINRAIFVGFEVLTAVGMTNSFFWDISNTE